MNAPSGDAVDPGEEGEPRPIWEEPDPWLDAQGELPDEERFHRDNVDAMMDTVGSAWVFAIIPLGLILLVLSAILGDWVWKAMILIPFAVYGAMAGIPLVARLRKDGELRLPGRAPLTGARARRALITAIVLGGAVLAYTLYGGLGVQRLLEWLRETLMSWTIPWPWDW